MAALEQRLRALEPGLGRAHQEKQLLRRTLRHVTKGVHGRVKGEVIVVTDDRLAPLPEAAAGALLNWGRGGYCRAVDRGIPRERPMGMGEGAALRDTLEPVTLSFPGYGSPRVPRRLQREGWVVHHQQNYRLNEESGLAPRA